VEEIADVGAGCWQQEAVDCTGRVVLEKYSQSVNSFYTGWPFLPGRKMVRILLLKALQGCSNDGTVVKGMKGILAAVLLGCSAAIFSFESQNSRLLPEYHRLSWPC